MLECQPRGRPLLRDEGKVRDTLFPNGQIVSRSPGIVHPFGSIMLRWPTQRDIYFSHGALESFNNWKKPFLLDNESGTSDAIIQCIEGFQNLTTWVKLANGDLNVDFKGLSLPEQDYIWINIIWQ